MKIAVIEDEKPIREGLVHILNKISPEYQVVGSAENGVEGLILLEEEMPDLIMLDIQMPVEVFTSVWLPSASYWGTNAAAPFPAMPAYRLSSSVS